MCVCYLLLLRPLRRKTVILKYNVNFFDYARKSQLCNIFHLRVVSRATVIIFLCYLKQKPLSGVYHRLIINLRVASI